LTGFDAPKILKGKLSMKIEGIRPLAGPNVYSYKPVLLMRLDLDELAERETREFKGFNQTLLTLLHGLEQHHCSLGRPGGFVTRLDEGTYFGHVVEHVALELTELCGIGKTHGKTRHDNGSIYNVAIEFQAEKASTYLLAQAVNLVETLLREEEFELEPVLEQARFLIGDAHVGPTTRAITEAASRRNIPCRRDGSGNRIQLGYGKYPRYVQASMTDRTSAVAVELAQDKDETKDVLRRNGIPVPKGEVVYSLEEATRAADEIGWPVVVKPLDGRQGKAVSLPVSTDIETPITSGGVIELNASPGLRMHHYPSAGVPRDVAQAVVDAIFPQDTPSRIPIISITGTNVKTTVTRMTAHVISQTGLCVGMTTTDGIYIAGEQVVEGDTTGPQSAQVVLSDPAVEAAVLENARGGILRRGLGYDWSDIGVMTNISDDHIGQDGIKSVEDVVYIKSLVAERVKEGGTLILNADDEHLSKLMECERVNRVPKKVVYFSLDENNALVRSHLQGGGTAYVAKNKALIESIGLIAGTSAGAPVMSETMLVEGGDEESHAAGGALRMAPVLGLIGGVIIDQHFMERGHVGRLIGAVAQNPKNLGIGIDEQTAIVVERSNGFYLIGMGAVYVIDGSEVTYSNIAE
jgi:cyanophycinase